MGEKCGACSARLAGLCGPLGAEALAGLSAIGRRRLLAPGETLIWEGEEADCVANIVSGVLKLSASTADGREQIVGIAYASDFVGRPGGGGSACSVTALGPAELCLFPKAGFEALAGRYPALQRALLERTLADLDRARRFMLLLGRKSAPERVATLLLDLAARQARPSGEVDLPLGRQHMADVLGLTIETVSRQLSRMRAEGIIALSGRRGLVVRAPAALEALAEAA